MEEKKMYAKKEAELASVPEKRELDAAVDQEADVPVAKKTKTDLAS